jgi:hypothetical protein
MVRKRLVNGSVVDPHQRHAPDPTFHSDADPVQTLDFEGSRNVFLSGRIYRSSRSQCELPWLHSNADPASQNYADLFILLFHPPCFIFIYIFHLIGIDY